MPKNFEEKLHRAKLQLENSVSLILERLKNDIDYENLQHESKVKAWHALTNTLAHVGELAFEVSEEDEEGLVVIDE